MAVVSRCPQEILSTPNVHGYLIMLVPHDYVTWSTFNFVLENYEYNVKIYISALIFETIIRKRMFGLGFTHRGLSIYDGSHQIEAYKEAYVCRGWKSYTYLVGYTEAKFGLIRKTYTYQLLRLDILKQNLV